MSEQERRPLCLDGPVGDLRHLKAGIDLRIYLDQLAFSAQQLDELAYSHGHASSISAAPTRTAARPAAAAAGRSAVREAAISASKRS